MSDTRITAEILSGVESNLGSLTTGNPNARLLVSAFQSAIDEIRASWVERDCARAELESVRADALKLARSCLDGGGCASCKSDLDFDHAPGCLALKYHILATPNAADGGREGR